MAPNNQEDIDDSDKGISHDGIDSSRTISEAIVDVIGCAPADHLTDIYAERKDRLSGESDAENRGMGINLDVYTEHEFSSCDATRKWMEWDSK